MAATYERFAHGWIRRIEGGKVNVYVGRHDIEPNLSDLVGCVAPDASHLRAFYIRFADRPLDLGLFDSEHEAVDAIFEED
ncbi:hypothetical protein VH571_10340 [Frondihabitans sp. 4ASC-45]|uniref:hypothetical protein n=1 Tax=Frondihabitans sp. 4ASC-45 TaxID=3111636 RepID=UPI003C1E6CCE